MYGTCLGHVWYVFGTYLDMYGPSPFRYRLLRLERSTQCVKDADKVARRMCLRWNVGSCRTICFYLNPTTSYFCSTFSLLNSRYIGAAHLGASLYVVCEKKKKFSKTSCVSNRCCSWAFSGDTTSHEWRFPVSSAVNAGGSSLHFKLWYQLTGVCLRCRWFIQFCQSSLVLTVFAHAFQMWWRLICGPRGVLMLFLSSNVAHHLEISFKNQAGSKGKLKFTLDFVLYKLRGSVKLMSEFLC